MGGAMGKLSIPAILGGEIAEGRAKPAFPIHAHAPGAGRVGAGADRQDDGEGKHANGQDGFEDRVNGLGLYETPFSERRRAGIDPL